MGDKFKTTTLQKQPVWGLAQIDYNLALLSKKQTCIGNISLGKIP